MKVSETFGSSYLTASDFPQSVQVTITGTVAHTFPNETKPKLIVSFAELEKQMVCNKINRDTIVAMHGDDTDLWPSKHVVLYATTTEFSGKIVPCIRVRQPQQMTQQQEPAQQAAVQQAYQAPPPVQQQTQAPPTSPGTYSEPIDPAQQSGPTLPPDGEVPWA